MIWLCSNKFQGRPNLRIRIILSLTNKCHYLTKIKISINRFRRQGTSTAIYIKRSKMILNQTENNFWFRVQVLNIWNQLSKGTKLTEVELLRPILTKCKQLVLQNIKRNFLTKWIASLPISEWAVSQISTSRALITKKKTDY